MTSDSTIARNAAIILAYRANISIADIAYAAEMTCEEVSDLLVELPSTRVSSPTLLAVVMGR